MASYRPRAGHEAESRCHPDSVPLVATELGKREATRLARFRSGVIATEELSNGYVFSFPGDGKWISLLADLMLAERECCPFLTFELAAQPDMGPLRATAGRWPHQVL